jgi:hypothetical protein
MFCRFCGATLANDSSFCHACGRSLTAAASSEAGAAQAPAVAPQEPQRAQSSSGTMFWRLVGVVLLLALGWYFVQQNVGGKPAITAIKEAARMPVDLKNETFGVPSTSWKAIGFQVPYAGSLTVSVQVTRGNPMEMFLTNDSGLQELKSTKQARYLGSFYSVKGTSFAHTERIGPGVYYFVVRDPSLGILSSSSSDVTLKAHIDP